MRECSDRFRSTKRRVEAAGIEPASYRRKPVVIQAIRYLPGQTCEQVAEFMGIEHNCGDCSEQSPWGIGETPEGFMEAAPGDWIIKDVQGDFYPCKPDIFEATYEPADTASVNGCGCMCHVGSGTRTSCEHCWMAEVEARDARIASLTNGMQLWADRAEAAEARARELEARIEQLKYRVDSHERIIDYLRSRRK